MADQAKQRAGEHSLHQEEPKSLCWMKALALLERARPLKVPGITAGGAGGGAGAGGGGGGGGCDRRPVGELFLQDQRLENISDVLNEP